MIPCMMIDDDSLDGGEMKDDDDDTLGHLVLLRGVLNLAHLLGDCGAWAPRDLLGTVDHHVDSHLLDTHHILRHSSYVVGSGRPSDHPDVHHEEASFDYCDPHESSRLPWDDTFVHRDVFQKEATESPDYRWEDHCCLKKLSLPPRPRQPPKMDSRLFPVGLCVLPRLLSRPEEGPKDVSLEEALRQWETWHEFSLLVDWWPWYALVALLHLAVGRAWAVDHDWVHLC
mmetsp:Transcript_11749/g.28487  ORF Transcript_11749/g.28487 Transcript_11749/m.28487 type:complete len:228 (-) Transcript_11749:231-914(-)